LLVIYAIVLNNYFGFLFIFYTKYKYYFFFS